VAQAPLPLFRPCGTGTLGLCSDLGCSPRLRVELLLFRSREILAIFVATVTPACIRSLLFSVSPCLSGRFLFFPITRDVGMLGDSLPIGRGSQTESTDHARSPDLLYPTPSFLNLCCKQSTSSQSTLGPPLRGAWVALGWPLRGPWVAQSQTQSQSPAERHRQRVATLKTQNATEIPLRPTMTRVAQPPSAVLNQRKPAPPQNQAIT
jgi:hypothetical protein